MGSQSDADIRGLIGATGSGKSFQIKRWLKEERPPRLIVWDVKGEYWRPGEHIVPRLSSLSDVARAVSKKSWAISYHPPIKRLDEKALVKQFECFCAIVTEVGHCMFIAEELSFTTKAGYAPTAWRNLITVYARDEEISVIGTTQRPVLVDKTFFSNCTLLKCSALANPDDMDTMRKAMNVPLQDVATLNLKDWITRDRRTGEVKLERLNTGAKSQKKVRFDTAKPL